MPFFNFYVAPNISLTDLTLVASVGLIFFLDKKTHFVLKKGKINFLYLLFFWTIISTFIILLEIKLDHYEGISLLKNITRLLFVIVFYQNIKYIIPNHKRLYQLISFWIKTLYFICFLGIVEFLLQRLGIYYSYYIDGITTETVRQTGAFRISSIFNEPSFLSIYLCFSLLIIAEYQKKYNYIPKRVFKKSLIIASITIVLSQSIIGIILLGLILYYHRERVLSRFLNKYRVFLILVMGAFILAVLSFNSERVDSITNQSDGSANHRLQGSYELFNFMVSGKYVFTGVGIGQQKNFLMSNSMSFDNHYFNKKANTKSGINNLYILILFQLGAIGLIIYLLFYIITFKSQPFILLFIIISGFAWALFFNPFYWLCLSILNIFINAPQNKEKNIIRIN